MQRPFVSVIIEFRNIVPVGVAPIQRLSRLLKDSVEDFELILVDNGSSDSTFELVSESMDAGEFENTLLLRLESPVDQDSALWAGVESSIGDAVLMCSGDEAGVRGVQILLEQVVKPGDFAVAINSYRTSDSLSYRIVRHFLQVIYKDTADDSLTRSMALSRRLVSFVASHNQPQANLRQMVRGLGIKPNVVRYSERPMFGGSRTIRRRYDSGLRRVMWRNPALLRLSSWTALGAAAVSLLYGLYTAAVAVFMSGLEPGWASLSLQISGMFFLVCVVLFVLTENILLIATLAGRDSGVFVSREKTSTRISDSLSKNLRVEEVPNFHEPPQETPIG